MSRDTPFEIYYLKGNKIAGAISLVSTPHKLCPYLSVHIRIYYGGVRTKRQENTTRGGVTILRNENGFAPDLLYEKEFVGTYHTRYKKKNLWLLSMGEGSR